MRNPRTSLPAEVLPALQSGHLNFSYKGISTLKCPFDLALYSMLLWNLKPRTIFEIGSNRGGSAIWLADQLRAYGIDGHVWSYDLVPVQDVSDPLVTFASGDASDLGAAISASDLSSMPRPFLVIEDSSHQRAHSAAVLEFFEPVMVSGEYIIVEDGIVTDLGISDAFEGGPGAAIAAFMSKHAETWEIDASYCDFYGSNVTWNPDGYLKKIR